MLRGISDAIDSVGGRFAGQKMDFVEEALAHESLSDGEYAVQLGTRVCDPSLNGRTKITKELP